MKIGSFTETLARTAARRPWLTIGIWVMVLIVAGLLSSMLLGGALTTDTKMTNDPESTQADTIINQRLGADNTLNEMVIVRSKTLTVDDNYYRQQVEDMLAGIMALGKSVVLTGSDYYTTGAESMVSADRHSTLISLTMPKGADKQIGQVYQVTDKYSSGGAFEVFHTGDASFNVDTTNLAEQTMKTGETIGIAVALVVLAIVFGALAAAFLPLILGIVAIVAALGLTTLVGQAMDLTFTITNMITMMGLAVGIDYSLFILTRFREERSRGMNKIDSIARTGATAGKAVLFSGVTVMLALAGLVLFPMTIFQTMGIGAIMVVMAAVTASLTLLPALLSIFGDKVNAIHIPFIASPRAEKEGEIPSGFWARVTVVVTRVPVVSLLFAIAILALAALPYFNINTGMSGITGIPDNLRAKQGFIVLQQEFHLGMDAPAAVVIDGDINNVNTQSAIASLQAKIAADPAFNGSNLASYPTKNLAVVYAGISGDPLSKQAMEGVNRLRASYIPETFNNNSNVRVMVTGSTAGILDFNQITRNYTPIIFGFVLSLSFLVLLLAFRSIVISATAVIMNMLSVGAAYGLMVLVFQKGVGASFFGFQQVDVIESWLPLFLFALLFGLSMDYHVFLLSRIRERFLQTNNNSAAVAFGLRSTGRLITGAALIMVAVFGGFALGDMVMFQQMGFGLAVAVFLDATLIRSILVPAAMKILGKYNWYLPAWLKWLPNISLGEHAAKQNIGGKTGLKPAPATPVVVAIPVREEP